MAFNQKFSRAFPSHSISRLFPWYRYTFLFNLCSCQICLCDISYVCDAKHTLTDELRPSVRLSNSIHIFALQILQASQAESLGVYRPKKTFGLSSTISGFWSYLKICFILNPFSESFEIITNNSFSMKINFLNLLLPVNPNDDHVTSSTRLISSIACHVWSTFWSRDDVIINS